MWYFQFHVLNAFDVGVTCCQCDNQMQVKSLNVWCGVLFKHLTGGFTACHELCAPGVGCGPSSSVPVRATAGYAGFGTSFVGANIVAETWYVCFDQHGC
jgi:hypothetical protein